MPAFLPRRALLAAAAAASATHALAAPALPQCRAGTLYLTIDTGWGREAEAIAAAMQRREIRATLFLANEPDFRGGETLGPAWADFWRARAAEGHAFGSHTWRHWYLAADPAPAQVRYVSRRRGEGAETLDGPGFCAELRKPVEALQSIAPDAKLLPLWRAPGGRTTPNALKLATACGLRHQGWSARGFLGDELDSAKYPNKALLAQALSRTQDGEVLLMHWGVRSRREPFGLIFEDLIAGLQARGFCFATLPASGVA
ncbi:polysaccharide deacetylase family protein [Pseudoroseomonas wenyumeiae]|uniref:Chitooligosaccharide deacetylase n=1 Tax=Teichococcus wenyumeiae TaxID=2478470 RepID=A0A3A9JTY9_9PROT|nr:polysaccharide deacetylase family protein [Pseudoroseomonas wenyumeiae]RKK04208.1 polysaccharide deacetylase family protein [Pseudoroseomonas wenyumeiae]RMI19242.1 polysaccharide deacetylase family protein [Pseudoroseomonas wenyumeiae]